MNRDTDETLAAFADGELPAEESARITRAMAGDAVLRHRVARFQASRRALVEVYGGLPRSEPSPALTALLAPGSGGEAGAEVRSSSGRRWLWPAAAAASVAILAGGYGLGRLHGTLVAPTPIDIQSSLDATRVAALESLANHQAFEAVLPSGGRTVVEPLVTFVDADGRFCRTYRLTVTAGGDTRTQLGEACRSGSGWTVLAERPAEAGTDAI
ncbi:MAG: hypothetical protein RLO50_11030 [Azospirillaceae bacterium]